MKLLPVLVLSLVATGCAGQQISSPETEATFTVVQTSDVAWEHLNPARGDASPSAATLWGDRNGTGPTGFLVRFADGFESPPHIHNVSYRGVVIRGLIHNDDPNADELWMPAGSFWTQPRGHVHITAARERDNLAYIEIDEGPYLVRPVEEAFHSEDRPLNLDASNIVWVDASSIVSNEQTGLSASAYGPEVAFLWGDPEGDQPSGILVKLPAGSSGMMRSHGTTFHAVVSQGRLGYREPGETDVTIMEPGSYLSSNGGAEHQVSCEAEQNCIIYVRLQGRFEFVPFGGEDRE